MSATGNQAISFEVKNQLAKLLATENITMYHEPGAKTASFDTDSRVLVLPVWQNISEDLYDMLVVHEVGHALDTPAEKWLTAITDISFKYHNDRKPSDNVLMTIKGFLNIVEDARIDKLQKRRYPGSKRNYAIGYKELNDMDFFGIQNKDVNGLSFMDRANIYFKSTGIYIKFTPEERALIRRMENTETFEDVVALTDELYGYAKAKNEKQKEEKLADQSSEESEDSDEDMDADDSDNNQDDLDQKDEDDTEASSNGSDDEEGENEGDDVQESDGEEVEATKLEKKNDGSDELKSETQEAYEESMSKIVMDNDVNYIYRNVPKLNHDAIIDDYTVVMADMEKELLEYNLTRQTFAALMTRLAEWRRKESDTISFMVKEFEMRKSADAYARIATAKTGVINTNKLPQYKFTEDIFKKVTVIPKGKNHGFVMFLDWSGSMSPNLDYTMKQLFSLTMFCKRVNIPFEVYLFRTHYQDYASPQQVIGDNTTVDFMGAFKIRNILSSRMNVGTLQKAYELLWIAANRQRFRCDRMESTPLNQTILAADKIVNDFRNKNKLQVVNTIFLTDGCSDPCVYKNSVPSPKKNGNKYIIRDEVTKKTYWLNDIYYGMTSTFLRILKDRTGCNLVGFYLYQGSQLGHLVSSGIIDDSVVNNEETRKCWKDNQFAAVESAGYDEYYIVRVVRQRVIDDLVVNSNMTKNQITKTFMKFSDRKSINRIMLTKFITRVANASY